MAGRDIIQIGPAGAGAAAARDDKMQGGTDMADKSIVLYFSVSSNTRAVAEIIRAQTGADIEEIRPATPYTAEYSALVEQAKREIRAGYRPPVAELEHDLSAYGVIYLGTPNWWSTIAPPVASLLEKYDLAGRRIAPFITHGGGGKGHAERDLRALCPQAQVTDMLAVYGRGGADTAQAVAALIARNRI